MRWPEACVYMVGWVAVAYIMHGCFATHAYAAPPYTFGVQPLDKAIEAGYIQTGGQDFQNKLQSHMVDTYAKPYYLDKLALPYFVYRKREIVFRFWGGNSLKFQPDRATLSIPF